MRWTTIRWNPGDDCPYLYEHYVYVPWEMHGLRGVFLPKEGQLASKYILGCDRFGCDPQKNHVFDRQMVTWATPLDRVWSDR